MHEKNSLTSELLWNVTLNSSSKNNNWRKMILLRYSVSLIEKNKKGYISR